MSEENKIYEEDENIITLEFEDGSAEDCVILGVFEFEGQDYIALFPVEAPEDDNEDESVYLYKYTEIGDEFELGDIEDEELFDRVSKEFERVIEIEVEYEDED